MRILHLLANWKWTGPAEPAVRLAANLAARHDVDFACGRCPHDDLENRVATEVRGAGLPLLDRFELRKHLEPRSAVRDVVGLGHAISAGAYRIVHTHLANDHLLGGIAARRRGETLVVRTVYGEEDLRAGVRTRYLFRRLTDGVIAASDNAARIARERFGLPDERVFTVPGAVDVARFDPVRLAALRPAARAELGFDEGHVVCGIVARVQRHRRFDLLLAAFARAAAEDQRLRLVIIGRGTHLDEVAAGPARALDVEDKVVFAGYRAGADYDAVLAALDIGLYLVPGSDGSCRAARELCAAGLPVLTTDRPPLDEIVLDGVNGRVVPEDEDAFGDAWLSISRDDETRAAMAAASRDRAEHFFSLVDQADEVEEIYCRLADLGRRP